MGGDNTPAVMTELKINVRMDPAFLDHVMP